MRSIARRTLFVTLLTLSAPLLAQRAGNALDGALPPPVTGPVPANVPQPRVLGPVSCAPAQSTPDLAWNGTSYLVAWIEAAPQPRLFVGRLSRDRKPLDGRGRVVEETLDFQSLPAVASDGNGFLVTWIAETVDPDNPYQLRARRISPEGVPTGPVLLLSPRPHRSRPDVAWSGQSYLVVWEESLLLDQYILGRRIAANGSFLDPQAFPISSAANHHPSTPSVIWGGGQFFVTWTESADPVDCEVLPCPWTTQNIRAARVGADGFVRDRPAIAISDDDAVVQLHPTASWDGDRYLVVWSRDENGPRRGLWGLFVRSDGEPVRDVDPTGLQILENKGTELLRGRTISDGTAHLIVWELVEATDSSIFGTRITKFGTFLDEQYIAGGFPIAFFANDEYDPAVIERPDGDLVVVAYSSSIDDDCSDSADIQTRFIGLEPQGPPPPDPPETRRRPARRP